MYRPALHTSQTFRRMSAVAVALSSALCAAGCAEVGDDATVQQDFAISASDDFEATSPAPPALPAGWLTYPTATASEWTRVVDPSRGLTYLQRQDNGGTADWNTAFVGATYGDQTVSTDLMVDSWKGASGGAIALYGRYNDNGTHDPTKASWYAAVFAQNGNLQIQKMVFANNVQTNYVLMDTQAGVSNTGVWYAVRMEVTQGYPVRVAVYLNGVKAAIFNDDGTTSGNVVLSNGYAGVGTIGSNGLWDDFSIGDANDVLPHDDASGMNLWDETGASS